MDEFIIRALIAGSLVAATAGLLGVFVVWRRMSFFGDTLAHSALLGVAIGLLLNIGLMVGVVVSTLIVGLILYLFQRQRRVSNDALLGILAHSGLSLGLITLSFVRAQNVNLEDWLFGDVLTVTWPDVINIVAILLLVALVMWWLWRPLLALTVHEELATVEGVKVNQVNMAFVLLVALLVASAMQVVGALLITALLIIPASTARLFAKTPEQMALIAASLGVVSVVVGVLVSNATDAPAGPSIVFASALLFFSVQLLKSFRA
ncbi:MAG: hypothetical protein CSB47_03570 [Proteobacteria bacterium]|nr:MAG: hypothetical protein CSB47_03570 [Pseudomonadota bacterium]